MIMPMSESSRVRARPPRPTVSSTRRVLLTGAVLGLLVGTLLTNLGTVLLELDESGTLGAACEHAEATIAGAPGGLLVGLAAAAVYLVLRRHRRGVALSLLGGAAGALVALMLVVFLLYPLATYLPIFVCPY
jgi:hypothetical protein